MLRLTVLVRFVFNVSFLVFAVLCIFGVLLFICFIYLSFMFLLCCSCDGAVWFLFSGAVFPTLLVFWGSSILFLGVIFCWDNVYYRSCLCCLLACDVRKTVNSKFGFPFRVAYCDCVCVKIVFFFFLSKVVSCFLSLLGSNLYCLRCSFRLLWREMHQIHPSFVFYLLFLCVTVVVLFVF